METKNKKQMIRRLVFGAILTALIILLQLMGSFIRFGPFSISLVLIPIIIGAATCGIKIGAWLGFVFGTVVLLSGDAAAFMSIDIFGTIITVMVKGTACGLAAGFVYKALEKYNRYVAVIAAAIVCPIINTGIFLLGCAIFFLETLSEWGMAEGYTNVAAYMFLFLAGGNFLFELATNIILSPVIMKVLNIEKNNSKL